MADWTEKYRKVSDRIVDSDVAVPTHDDLEGKIEGESCGANPAQRARQPEGRGVKAGQLGLPQSYRSIPEHKNETHNAARRIGSANGELEWIERAFSSLAQPELDYDRHKPKAGKDGEEYHMCCHYSLKLGPGEICLGAQE